MTDSGNWRTPERNGQQSTRITPGVGETSKRAADSPNGVNPRAIPRAMGTAGRGAEHRQAFGVALEQARRHHGPPAKRTATACRFEGVMATRDNHRIVETPTEARQGEPGPSVLALLAVSLDLHPLEQGDAIEVSPSLVLPSWTRPGILVRALELTPRYVQERQQYRQ